MLDEREFELVNIIGAKLGSNQRDLSRLLDLSLGQTNMLIRRLIAKGYIRITQLNKRKVKYLLTPKGLAEKMRKSIRYTLKTIHSISLIKERIRSVVTQLYENGERDLIILGKSDLALLVEMVFKELGFKEYHLTYVDSFPMHDMKGALLICKELQKNDSPNSRPTVNLIHELAKDDQIVNPKDI